ncbi:unnamed protein product, partial [Tetraodon nigroviridis]
VLHRGNPRLHRSRGLHAKRIQQALRLVEPRRHHVRDADRLPAVLLRDASGNLQESDELARNADLPPRSAYIGEGQGPYSQARTHFDLLWFCVVVRCNSKKKKNWLETTFRANSDRL